MAKATEKDMVNTIIKDIGTLKIKMLLRATDIIEPYFNDKNEDVNETKRKIEVRTIRAILTEKIKTLEIVRSANEWLNAKC